MNESLGKWVSIIHRYNRSFIDKEFAGLDIKGGHLPFIHVLYHQDGLSQDGLSGVLSMDKTTTARAIKQLVALGYVTKKRDPQDKRFYRLSLTAKGKDVMPRLERTLKHWTEVLATGFTENERQLALDLLKKMAENASAFKQRGFS